MNLAGLHEDALDLRAGSLSGGGDKDGKMDG
jgi:hypothetical protein